jgi:hypothetical protein
MQSFYMKSHILLAMSIIALTIVSCKKTDDTRRGPHAGSMNYHFTVRIDGVSYTGANISGNYDAGNISKILAGINYKGRDQTMMVAMGEYNGTGKYSTQPGTQILLGDAAETFTSKNSEPVSIEVTSEEGQEVFGKFSGKLYNTADLSKSITLTDGDFHTWWSK